MACTAFLVHSKLNVRASCKHLARFHFVCYLPNETVNNPSKSTKIERNFFLEKR